MFCTTCHMVQIYPGVEGREFLCTWQDCGFHLVLKFKHPLADLNCYKMINRQEEKNFSFSNLTLFMEYKNLTSLDHEHEEIFLYIYNVSTPAFCKRSPTKITALSQGENVLFKTDASYHPISQYRVYFTVNALCALCHHYFSFWCFYIKVSGLSLNQLKNREHEAITQPSIRFSH